MRTIGSCLLTSKRCCERTLRCLRRPPIQQGGANCPAGHIDGARCPSPGGVRLPTRAEAFVERGSRSGRRANGDFAPTPFREAMDIAFVERSVPAGPGALGTRRSRVALPFDRKRPTWRTPMNPRTWGLPPEMSIRTCSTVTCRVPSRRLSRYAHPALGLIMTPYRRVRPAAGKKSLSGVRDDVAGSSRH